MLADMNTSRARIPTEPIVSPNAVHDATLATTTNASEGMLERCGWKRSSSRPIRNPQAETIRPLARTGSDRPMNTAKRFAGLARSGDRVW
jgi:hypothetical protein